jgi:hypothetical protein
MRLKVLYLGSGCCMNLYGFSQTLKTQSNEALSLSKRRENRLASRAYTSPLRAAFHALRGSPASSTILPAVNIFGPPQPTGGYLPRSSLAMELRCLSTSFSGPVGHKGILCGVADQAVAWEAGEAGMPGKRMLMSICSLKRALEGAPVILISFPRCARKMMGASRTQLSPCQARHQDILQAGQGLVPTMPFQPCLPLTDL